MKRVFAFLGAAIVALAVAAPAHAQEGESIVAYDVAMTVASNGLLTVHEDITYDFGSTERHGIVRDLVEREVYVTKADSDRLYQVDVGTITADGETAQASVETEGNYRRIRIGDPDRTITGVHQYGIDYTVEDALTGFPDHDELFWDAIGNQSNVPIANAMVEVTMPAPITKVACFSGVQGAHLACDSAQKIDNTAQFFQKNLSSNQGVTVVVAVPAGTIQPPPAPVVEKQRTADDAFARRADTLLPAGGLAVLGIGGVLLLLWRKGRDRRYRGSAVDQAMGNTTGAEEPMPLVHRRTGPVEFVPPDGVRPGQVGVLADENANLLDITATIVDLAVRGYLTIMELPAEGFLHRRHDYELHALKVDPQMAAKLLAYEQQILLALFKSGETVRLSDLKYKFRADLSGIRTAMYDDAVQQGWYRTRPDGTRLAWHILGVIVIAAGVALTWAVAASTSYGIVPLAVVLTGLVLLAVAGRMPARTGKGSAMLSRIRGFRRLFDEGDEDIRSRFAEQHNIFSQYLAYAIVFGCTEKWARAFQGLDADQMGTTSWYGGHAGLTAVVLASALDDFGTVATGTLYASQPSSSGSSGFSSGGGFSGGGGGGGGVGSW